VTALLEHKKAEARWTGRYIASAWLETIGLALLLCVPVVLLVMPLVFPPATYPFNPLSEAGWLVATGLPILAIGMVLRPRILRPDFVNSIMLYQEDQS
jgi:hypothetical protein